MTLLVYFILRLIFAMAENANVIFAVISSFVGTSSAINDRKQHWTHQEPSYSLWFENSNMIFKISSALKFKRKIGVWKLKFISAKLFAGQQYRVIQSYVKINDFIHYWRVRIFSSSFDVLRYICSGFTRGGGGGNLSKTKGEKGEDFYAIQNFHRLSSVILIMSSLFRLI